LHSIVRQSSHCLVELMTELLINTFISEPEPDQVRVDGTGTPQFPVLSTNPLECYLACCDAQQYQLETFGQRLIFPGINPADFGQAAV
jgi:hypothetical protein